MFPIVFRIGDFFLPAYGLLITIAFLTALWMAARLGQRAGLNRETVLNLGIYVALAGIAGAKLLLVVLDLGYYTSNPRELFSLTTLRAGGVFYGGLVLALGVAFLYMRRKKLPGLVTADVFAPAIALGHAIGRIGCFAAGCCWGKECSLPWAVTFTNRESNRLVGVPLDRPLHPTQLYEAAAEAVIFAILYRRFHRAHRPGAIIGLYLVLYSAARFLVEFFRAHDEFNRTLGPFVVEQWIALALMASGVWLLARKPAPAPKPVPKPGRRAA